MITFDYKYTEIELAYADYKSGNILSVTVEIAGHRKTRNKKLILRQLEALGMDYVKDYSIRNVAFKEKQYRMTEANFMKYAEESLF